MTPQTKNAGAMTLETLMSQLESLGDESTRRIYARQGGGDRLFGVRMGDLRGLAKKIKTNHPLALPLWGTGNADAQLLATMIMDPTRPGQREIDAMMKPLGFLHLVEEFAFKVAAKSPHAQALREAWLDSPKEWVARAGWNLMVAHVIGGGFDGPGLGEVLRRIEREYGPAPRPKKEAMTRCLIEIGVRHPDRRQECIAIGERFGRWDDRPVSKGCTPWYAPDGIAAVLRRK
ncbi:MAG: DNA alkylation repair protein [Planctomycetes bacterium]|nr:DNA alkylation repair protein [Planctomycetota bacterium]